MADEKNTTVASIVTTLITWSGLATKLPDSAYSQGFPQRRSPEYYHCGSRSKCSEPNYVLHI